MTDQRNAFIENGWQQFCIIQPNSHTSLLEYAHTNIEENDLLLVVTQTCDLVNEVDKEPFFEVLPLHPLLNQKPSPEYQYAKNSRRIELVLNINDREQNFYALPFQRFFARHEILTDISPFATIQDEESKIHLIKWITSRYNRTAFPDTFDQRWKARKKQIEKTIKKLQLINDIYIKLSPLTELANDDEYDLDIILLMDAHSYDDPTIYQNYNQIRQALENQFSQCAGINIDSIDLRSNADISVRELQEYARWDYSYLSFRDPEDHAQPRT